MRATITAIVAFALIASAAEAARQPDLTVALEHANPVPVGTSQTYTVTVSNDGRKRAESVAVVINLLKTNTSPNLYLLESVDNLGSGCTLVGATITCSLGKVGRGKSKSRSFDYTVRVTDQPLDITAAVSTPSPESSTSNNDAALTIISTYHPTPITAPAQFTASHCTGQGLTEFYACEVSPTSISTHTVDYHPDGTLSFPDYPGYAGTWTQATDDVLKFEYTLNGAVTASFSGYGAGNGCFEGITTFPPNPAYNAAYRVCPK